MAQSVFSPEQVSQLEQPLDPGRVKHRQGGGGAQLAYLKGHDMINTANRIFGFGNWGYDLVGVELVNVPGENGESVGSYYAARVRVSVKDCVPITEEGVCPVQEGRNPRARIDAHDMARKGAITDALKRALRCFGDQFGNSAPRSVLQYLKQGGYALAA
jgi:DNA repair and recombination protein RAD52